MNAELLFTVWSIVQSQKVQVSGSVWEEYLQRLQFIVLAPDTVRVKQCCIMETSFIVFCIPIRTVYIYM